MGTHVNGAIAEIVQVNIQVANYTVTAAQSGTIFANQGSITNSTAQLPPAAKGLQYGFHHPNEGIYLRIEPDGTDKIGAGFAGKYLELQDISGSTVTIACTNPGEWDIVAHYGTLTFEP